MLLAGSTRKEEEEEEKKSKFYNYIKKFGKACLFKLCVCVFEVFRTFVIFFFVVLNKVMCEIDLNICTNYN